MNDPLRGTGRTTRMLQKAAWLAKNGRRVVVVMDHPSQSRDIGQVMSGVEVVSSRHCTWSWHGMRMQGFSDDTIFLVDHYALEMRRDFLQRQINILNEFEGKQNDPYSV